MKSFDGSNLSQMSEARGQRPEARGQKSEVRGQRSGVRYLSSVIFILSFLFFGTAANLGQIISSSAWDSGLSILADGLLHNFDSDRPGPFREHDIRRESVAPVVDFNGDRIVNFKDYCKLAQYWGRSESSVDIAPPPLGDGKVDFKDLAVLAGHWLEQFEEIVYIKWLGHASVKFWAGDVVIYVDPRNLSESPHDATLVLVTHTHGDHYQPADIAKVSGPETIFIAPADVVARQGTGQVILPGQTFQFDDVTVTAVPAYNTNKPNHPKSNNWVGFIVELAGKRIYVAGDTDLIPEMQTLGKIDVAFLPAGGTYTMNATEAAQAANIIKPTLAIPYHWGQNVGTLSDAQTFAQKAACAVKIMTVGETISSDNWPKYSPLIAHWKLDEAEGSIAYDSSGNNDGTLNGDPLWQPAGGQVKGAIQIDGIDDYVSTPFILSPAAGPFSVYAWIKGGAPGQVVISQAGGEDWLSVDPSQGKFMTRLMPPAVGRVPPQPLVSEFVITDGNWHRVGFVWDGSGRILYVDDVEVAKDTQASLAGSTGGLHIGAGKNLEPASFFFGLIDDIRIYNQPMSPEDIRNESRDR